MEFDFLNVKTHRQCPESESSSLWEDRHQKDGGCRRSCLDGGCVCPRQSSANENKWMSMWQCKRVGDWAEVIPSTPISESVKIISREHPSVAARRYRSASSEVSRRRICDESVVQDLIRKNCEGLHLLGPAEQLDNEQLTGWERARHGNRWREGRQRRRASPSRHERSQLRDVNKHLCTEHTYIDHIGDIVDVIFCHHRVCRRQVQQVVIPGFCAFQLILWILGLPLERRDETEQTGGWGLGGGSSV